MPNGCLQIKGLAGRREARLRSRRQHKSELLELWKVPKGEKRELHRATVYLMTLPPERRIAVYKAAQQLFGTDNQESQP